MQRPIFALLLTGALVGTTGTAFAQTSSNPPQSVSPLPGFTSADPRPGVYGSSPASSGSNVGSNVGAGASASPLGNEPMIQGGANPAPEQAEAPRTRPLFGLSQQFPVK
jgi:hypothetical protein